MSDSTAVIRLQSKFDFSWFARFKELYEPALGNPAIKEIVVNFADVSYIDSSALGMLMLLKERAEAAGKRVRLSQCRGYAKDLLTVANFQSKFTMD